MPLDHSPISRRTIAKGAAWSVPAVAVAATAPALAASSMEYQTVTKNFVYSAMGIADIAVSVTASNVPLNVHPGEALTPISVESTVTIPENLVGTIQDLFLGGAAQITGTSESTSALSGGGLPAGYTTTTDLTIPMTPIPDTGDFSFTATGTGAATTLPAGTEGVVTITMGEPVSVLVGHNADGSENGSTYDSNLTKKDGNDYTLATFTIH